MEASIPATEASAAAAATDIPLGENPPPPPPPPPPAAAEAAPGAKEGKRQMTPSSAGKKRPYRRTKRPKNYCDKSTVTTTTSTAQTPVNVFDAVLGECEDLLRACLESQRLGRLKMASAYQLLLQPALHSIGADPTLIGIGAVGAHFDFVQQRRQVRRVRCRCIQPSSRTRS